MFKAFAGKIVPAASDMQAVDGFIVTSFSDTVFQGIQPVCVFAIPGEEQAIGSSFKRGLCTACLGGGKFDDEGGGSWFGLGAVLAQEAHTGTALAATGLCKHVQQFAHMFSHLLLIMSRLSCGRDIACVLMHAR